MALIDDLQGCERIDKALHAIEEANLTKLRDVFQDISFNSNKLGDEQQKNDILRHLPVTVMLSWPKVLPAIACSCLVCWT